MPPSVSPIDRLHEDCRAHRQYVLSCAQYDELLARSSNLCEICELPGAESRHGKLCIDHDYAYGRWAVRGLLCDDCNKNMRRIPAGDERLLRYVEMSWFALTAERFGITLGEYPEPPLRAVVCEPQGRHWRRYKRGWVLLNPYRHQVRMPVSWRRLIYDYGPIHLRQH